MKLFKSIFRNSIPLLAILLILWSCTNSTEIVERNWELVWEDNFNGEANQAPDQSKWSYDIGTGDNGWGNGEFQYYTDKPDNISLDGNGNLVITARNESFAGSGFTSGRIKTKGLFDQAYGRFEARIKLPYGPGLWPAFWLLGADIDENPWPQCGEIDIMEYRGQQTSLVNGTVHGPGYSAGASITKSFGLEKSRFDVDYHIFAIEWGPDYIHFFVDKTLYQEITPDDVTGEWVYDHPFYILLNLAVGGSYVGFPTSETPFPQSMVVDYVRVYKEAE